MITIKSVPEIRDDGRGYKMIDSGGVEIEVSQFLWGLIRILKPKRCLTTGIYTGISDLYIADALKENGYGYTDALEYEPKHIERANSLWNEYAVDSYIKPHLISSLDFNPEGVYEFMFLDTEPQIRFAELVKFYPHLVEGGYVFIHDLEGHLGQEDIRNPDHPDFKYWPWGELPREIQKWLREDQLRMMSFPNPRGMVGFYKVKGKDYQS